MFRVSLSLHLITREDKGIDKIMSSVTWDLLTVSLSELLESHNLVSVIQRFNSGNTCIMKGTGKHSV